MRLIDGGEFCLELSVNFWLTTFDLVDTIFLNVTN